MFGGAVGSSTFWYPPAVEVKPPGMLQTEESTLVSVRIFGGPHTCGSAKVTASDVEPAERTSGLTKAVGERKQSWYLCETGSTWFW